ncbi:MAG: ABC-2 family transporter protein [Deltaproteobacteria bacterium]|nr:ABC-2 family transporter protein [Deltaproteobacteria bacterium]
MLLQYRAAAIAGVFTQIFFGFVFIMVYEAFYASSSAPKPMAFSDLVSYVWLGQALLAMLPWNADSDVRVMVRTGAVAYELCRPVDLYTLWFARAVAQRTAPTILRAVPMALFVTLGLPLLGLDEWSLGAPAQPLAFVIAVTAALALACALTTLINITLLWTIAGDGVVMMAATIVAFCSGMLVPLPLFPQWLQDILAWLPFAGVVDLPFRIYTGGIPTSDLALVLAKQLAWTALLVLAGRLLLARAMKRVVVQGG